MNSNGFVTVIWYRSMVSIDGIDRWYRSMVSIDGIDRWKKYEAEKITSFFHFIFSFHHV